MAKPDDDAVSKPGPGLTPGQGATPGLGTTPGVDPTPGSDPPGLRGDWRTTWLDRVIEDPNKIPSAVLITGYLTKSPDEKAIRVFFDPQLSWCVDIPKDAILHREDISKSTSPLGGSYVWIDRGAWSSCRTYWRQW